MNCSNPICEFDYAGAESGFNLGYYAANGTRETFTASILPTTLLSNTFATSVASTKSRSFDHRYSVSNPTRSIIVFSFRGRDADAATSTHDAVNSGDVSRAEARGPSVHSRAGVHVAMVFTR